MSITGLNGTFKRVKSVKRMKPRKSFEIENLVIRDMRIAFTDTTRTIWRKEPVTVSLEVEELQSAPFRSKLSIYDILFKSTGRGVLEKGSFTIEKTKREKGNGGENRWALDGLPLELLGAYIGGPFRWISQGGIYLEVKNRWHMGNKPGIEMDVNLVLRDVQARIPDDYPPDSMKRKMAGPVVAYINGHSEEMSFHFSLSMDEEVFKNVVSLEGAGLWESFGKKLMKELLLTAGTRGKEKVKELGKKGLKKLKDFMNRKRKEK